jgi:hypothetical protein
MEKAHSAKDAAVIELYSRGESVNIAGYSSRSFEEGWRLMRTFLDIRNPAVRNIILDVVFVLAQQDSQIGADEPRN